eukprot:gene5836-6120_t
MLMLMMRTRMMMVVEVVLSSITVGLPDGRGGHGDWIPVAQQLQQRFSRSMAKCHCPTTLTHSDWIPAAHRLQQRFLAHNGPMPPSYNSIAHAQNSHTNVPTPLLTVIGSLQPNGSNNAF